MKKVAAISPVDHIGDPEPAVLVDSLGFPVDESTIEPAECWNILAFAPLEPFLRFLIEQDACSVASQALGMPKGSPGGLVLALQMGEWQHRVLLPLLGPVVARYLEAREPQAPVFTVQLTATGIPEARSFEVSVPAGTFALAQRVTRLEFDADHGVHRREMAELCLTAASQHIFPTNADGRCPALVTLARVWPPGLAPLHGPSDGTSRGRTHKR